MIYQRLFILLTLQSFKIQIERRIPVLHNTDKDTIYDLPEMNPWCIKRYTIHIESVFRRHHSVCLVFSWIKTPRANPALMRLFHATLSMSGFNCTCPAFIITIEYCYFTYYQEELILHAYSRHFFLVLPLIIRRKR